jgi:hypothetical protein
LAFGGLTLLLREHRPSFLRPGLRLYAYVTTADGSVTVVDLVKLKAFSHFYLGPGLSGLREHPTRSEIFGVSSAGADVVPTPAPKFSVQLINHLDQSFKGELVLGEENRKGDVSRTVELLPYGSSTVAISIPSPTEKTTAAHVRGAVADSVWFSVRRAGSRENITTRRVPVVWANAHVTQKLSVGYVRGFDFSLPQALDADQVEHFPLFVGGQDQRLITRNSARMAAWLVVMLERLHTETTSRQRIRS